MKKIVKAIVAILILLAIVIVGAITYVTQALPDIDPPADLKVEVTPERIERGEYLANSVCVCMDCHSTRDWNAFAAPLVEGTLGKGGEKFDRTMNFPGEFYSKNITPFALANWSDGEIYRAITSGMSKDGHPFFPVMPYGNYNKLASEDVYSIIAYLRSLDPIETQPYPASDIDFPLSVIMRTFPQPAQPMERPAMTDPRYGEYVTNAAACIECHTNMVKGEKVGGTLAGGFEFRFPNGGIVRSANITPSDDGIGRWSKEQFIQRFKMYQDSAYVAPTVNWERGDMQTPMPWMMYSTMTETDLGAIHDYLMTVPAVDGVVEKWTPPGS